MPTTNGNRKLLDLKRWEFCTPAPVATSAGVCIGNSLHIKQQQFYLTSNTVAYLYNPFEDGFIRLASPALAGTFGAGVSVVSAPWSTGSTVAAASLTATGGSTTTIITNQTLARSLAGFGIQILSGPNAGATLTISSNTIGTNATITVPAQASAFDATTTYRLLTPRWYILGAGTLAAGSFKVYDYATNTYTTLTQTGLAASIGTDGRLIATPSWEFNNYVSFATGTATAGDATTLTNSAKTWTTNQWTNYQIRITSGTGAGQIRTIASNTGTVITVSANWTTNPDATSQYSIEGNDNFLYYMGNNAVTLYRYNITTNTWSTLSPTAARAGAPGAGMSGHWISTASDTAWQNESAIINGNRIYSFRGAAGAVLDYYDIAANTWVSDVTYSPATETFTTGTKYALINEYLYMQSAGGRWFRYDVTKNEMEPYNTMTYTQGAAVAGDTAFRARYTDGATNIDYIYMILNTSSVLLRQMVI